MTCDELFLLACLFGLGRDSVSQSSELITMQFASLFLFIRGSSAL